MHQYSFKHIKSIKESKLSILRFAVLNIYFYRIYFLGIFKGKNILNKNQTFDKFILFKIVFILFMAQ